MTRLVLDLSGDLGFAAAVTLFLMALVRACRARAYRPEEMS